MKSLTRCDYFAVEIGCYASDVDAKSYEKVPPPELNEIEKNRHF